MTREGALTAVVPRVRLGALAAVALTALLVSVTTFDAAASARPGAKAKTKRARKPAPKPSANLPVPGAGTFVVAQLQFKGSAAKPKTAKRRSRGSRRGAARRSGETLVVTNRRQLPPETTVVTITQQPARAKRARRRRARHGGKRRRTRLVARSAARRGRVPRAPKVNTTDYVLMYRPATARADVGSPLVRTRYADGRSGKLRVGVKFLRLASIDREGMFLPRKVCRLLSRKGLTYGVETQLGRVLRSVAAPTDVFRGRIALRRPDQALAIESLGFGCGKLAGTGVKDMLDDARRNGSVLEAPPPSVVNVPGRVIGGLTEIPPNGGSGGPGGSGNGGGSGGGGGGGDDGGGDSGGGGDPPPPPPPPPAECPDGENPDCPAPANTAAPSISPGSAGLGTALSCSQGSWSNEPTSFAYQWYRNGSGISGATSSSYTTQSADYNQPLTCKVTASNAGGSTLSPASNTVTPTWNQGGGGGGGGGGCGYQYLSRSSTRVCLVT